LTKGGVFAKEMIDLWIDYKMTKEVNPMRMRPHPFEFHLYYDI
jgi:glutamine synthetase